jgi:DNA-binding beta-propeller fold protein YncE
MYNKFATIVAGITSTDGTDTKHLNSPSCVYLDSKKNIYICDTGNNRIMKYSPDNPKEGIIIIDNFRNGGLGQHLYIDQRNDDLYFVDYDDEHYYRVQYLPQNSTQIKAIILFIGNKCRSSGMDLDYNRNIYVSEFENHHVVKWLSPKYDDYIVVAGSNRQGTESYALTNPQGIYLNPINNDLYVSDAHRVQLWPSESLRGQTVVPSFFPSIFTITRDCHGNLYVVDDYEHVIRLFSQSIEDTGIEGISIVGVPYDGYFPHIDANRTDYLSFPRGLYLDDETGDLYIADVGFNRILKMSINGSFIPGKINL